MIGEDASTLHERMLFNVPFVAEMHRRAARDNAIILRSLSTCVTPENFIEQQLSVLLPCLGNFAFHTRRVIEFLEIKPPENWYELSADMKLTDDNLLNFQGDRMAPVETNFAYALNRVHHISSVSPQMIRAYRPKVFRDDLDEGELRQLIVDTDEYGAATLDIAAMAHTYLAFVDNAARNILDIK